MPDITKCPLHQCSKAKHCYRHEAKVDFESLQSWFYFEDADEEQRFIDTCEYYWEDGDKHGIL